MVLMTPEKRKYVIGKWIMFQMIDDNPIMEHVHEYENLTTDVLNEGMEMCEILQANVLLERFPPSWSNMNQLKHKKKNLTLQELINHMRTEKANRLKDEEFERLKNKDEISLSLNSFKANLVEYFSTFVKDRFKGKQKKGQDKGQREGQSSKNGGKAPVQANITEGGDVIAAESANGECVYMGNSTTGGVMGKGKILLKLTSGKTLALNNVLYVPSLRRNLVFSPLLNKAGIKLIFESDKVVISRGGDFVGKGYLSEGLFILNIAQDSTKNASTFNSAYIAESTDLWYGRLGHINIASIKRFRKIELISAVNVDNFFKCPVCVEAKHTKKPFKNVISRKTDLLELVHSDLANFKNIVSKGRKKYYITFVGDFSGYAKVYLLKSKDEVESIFLKYKVEVENQLDRKIKRLRCDRGGKYSTNTLETFCENGIINEHVFPLKNNVPSDVPNNASTSMSVNSHIVPSSSVISNEHKNKFRRSKRHRIEASFGADIITTFLTKNIHLDVLCNELELIYLIEEDPKTYNKAMRSIDANFWKEIIKSELESIVSNHTWNLSDLPKGCKLISSK
ncbi:uncharacterized protein LOC142163773 [Nicotiana tabacum]|uniref:Uncharacterized protein LOC142163773 n=1 Tax=Nicotiana tabacum TaxID=4097 RepID=A0AC58RWB6_TOBAC